MAMFIIKPWYRKIGFDPNDYFNPTTHIATEENFIKLLQAGIYTSDVIGYKVQLSNSVDYNNGLWVIADVNHDSTNTGQTNCYDLISLDCFHKTDYSGYSPKWRDTSCIARTWLNNTFYPGFSTEFKNHILKPKYKSQSTWYTNDKVILPSYKEVNGGTSSYQDNEGVAYPIFTDNASRKKYQTGTTSYGFWWTRSLFTYNGSYVWYVSTNGSMNSESYGANRYLTPLLRIS